MCKVMEDMRNEVADKAARKADYERRILTAKNLLNIGKLSYEEIAECSDLTMEEVMELAQKDK